MNDLDKKRKLSVAAGAVIAFNNTATFIKLNEVYIVVFKESYCLRKAWVNNQILNLRQLQVTSLVQDKIVLFR